MVVVVIIAIMATLAIPQAVLRMRERRSQEAAERIATLFRTARMRAMGRGAAVSVRYVKATSLFGLHEAVQDVGSGNLMPSSRCLDLSNTPFSSFKPASGLYEGVTVTATNPDAPSIVEVCFTPLGSATYRTASDGNFESLGKVLTFDVARTDGLVRTVLLLPNGTARVTARAP